MSREPQPRRTAEKRRFSNTAVQAIHQRRRWAVARVGAMVRCVSDGPAPALQTPAHRPQLQLWLYPTRVTAGAQRPDCQPPAAQAVGARRKRSKPQPCQRPGPPRTRDWLVPLPSTTVGSCGPSGEASPSVHSEVN